MSKLRVVLADDHQMLREGLRALVNAQPDMEIVGEADTGRAAVALARQLQPDLVVMDVSMRDMNGLKATQRLKQECPGISVLTLTRHEDTGTLQQLMRAGANGYVTKRSASGELLRAIRTVGAGQNYLDPAVTREVFSEISGRRGAAPFSASRELSTREEEVLRLVALGHSNKEIASHLDISVKTVEAHKSKAMAKLGMKGRIDVVRYAMLREWLDNN